MNILLGLYWNMFLIKMKYEINILLIIIVLRRSLRQVPYVTARIRLKRGKGFFQKVVKPPNPPLMLLSVKVSYLSCCFIV